MKLQYSPNSPYVRKVVLLALELGLNERIVRDAVTLSPYDPNPAVVQLNPLGKIPVRDTQWFPVPGPARWHALRVNALANGMLESAQLARFESARPEEVRYAKWSDAQLGKVGRGFTWLDANLPADADMGAIAVACAIGWLDFRFPELNWRADAPRLAQWFERFSARQTFINTRHPGQ